jgi:hypothetical protein
MLKRILLGILLSIGISACQSEKEKAYDDLMNDLENWEDSTADGYFTDQEACVEYLGIVVPMAMACTGDTVPADLRQLIVDECTAMDCNTVFRDVSKELVKMCSDAFTCDDSKPVPEECNYQLMVSCDTTQLDEDTEEL